MAVKTIKVSLQVGLLHHHECHLNWIETLPPLFIFYSTLYAERVLVRAKESSKRSNAPTLNPWRFIFYLLTSF